MIIGPAYDVVMTPNSFRNPTSRKGRRRIVGCVTFGLQIFCLVGAFMPPVHSLAASLNQPKISDPSAENQQPPTSWGVYQIYWNSDQFERELDEQLAKLGGTPSYVLFFFPITPALMQWTQLVSMAIILEITTANGIGGLHIPKFLRRR